jgi:hypothetical protein
MWNKARRMARPRCGGAAGMCLENAGGKENAPGEGIKRLKKSLLF